MKVKITQATPEMKKPKPTDENKLGFGAIFTDHFFTMKYATDKGWYDAQIEPYRPLMLDPAAMALHYGQEIFEGLKAYRAADEAIYLFRPADNFRRLNSSARRLCMPEVDVDEALEALKQLVILEKDWIPRGRGTSLYIRPTMIATEPALGVRPAKEYLFYIIVGPVGAYYPQGFSPTKIYVTTDHVRTVVGGIGSCKAAANYAASLLAGEEAGKMVLWLDAAERKYVEEVGTSNMFFMINDELITAPLGGTILAGITRNSVIRLAKSWGVKVSERSLSMDEVMAAIAGGTMQEAFASGTAAVVSPVGQIYYRGKEYPIGDGWIGKLTERLYNELIQIQYGLKDDPFGWRVKIAD